MNIIIEKSISYKSDFRVDKRVFDDGRVVYDVIANINNKHYEYNGFKSLENAYRKLEKYKRKTYELYIKDCNTFYSN